MTSQGRPDYICRPDISSTFAKMFNNPRFSNIKFCVNNDVYYGEKNFLRVSSPVWDVLLSTFPNRGMTEYSIHSIKNSESLLTILKYVYSQPINLSKMSDEVLVEVIVISKMLFYLDFHNDLKNYAKEHRPSLDVNATTENFFSTNEDQISSELEAVNLGDSEENR